MSEYSDMFIDVAQILLDPINPRHEPLESQVALIKGMIDVQKEKLVKLAEDIVTLGLNPSDLISVIPHNSEKNKYIVVEGNRRITALKLLSSPSLCHDNSIRSRFESLNKVYIKSPISTIKCIVYSDRESAKHWISLKHTGENDGIGTVRWDAIAIKRFQAQATSKKESIGLQLLNFILDNHALDDASRKLIKNIPITTVERLLNDPDVRKSLGLNIEKGELKSQLNKESAANILYDFFVPFATGDKNVKDVYYKNDRKDYLSDFGPAPISIPSNLAHDSWPLNTPPKPSPTKSSTPVPVPKPRSRPLSTARTYLIPSDCIMKISSTRINAIYHELRKELIVADVPNACSVLLRVFLEVSVDHYNDTNKVGAFADELLHKKIAKVADFM